MDRLITLLFALILSGAIAGVSVAAWERHPAWSWHAHILLWHPGFDLPGGPITVTNEDRDAALKAFRMAQDGNKLCHSSLAVQNASVAQAAQAGAKALTLAQNALDATKVQNVRLRAAASSLKTFTTLPGENACQHWERADGAVLAALMGVR